MTNQLITTPEGFRKLHTRSLVQRGDRVYRTWGQAISCLTHANSDMFIEDAFADSDGPFTVLYEATK